jgi:serine/threonine-protein kinase
MDGHDTWGLAEGDEIAPRRYAVQLLGGGRRYEAYLAWDDELWTLVVAKLIRPSLVDDAATLAGLEGEVRALEALNHPALVRSFGAVLSGERPHVVLEYLDGPRLSTLIRRYGVIVEQLLPLALELSSALHYIGKSGFVHLDVKPKNVIMSAPPRLIDLSVATPVADVARLASPTGTDAYMAPEQCDYSRFAEIGPASDMWGLGVTLYESLARSLPFHEGAHVDGAAPEERYPQLVEEPAPMPADVHPELAAVVMSCLSKLPEERPTASELASTLEPWVASLPQARLGLFRPGGRTRQSVFLAA